MEKSKFSQTWKRSYTLVLAANALYIILFYLIMKKWA